MHNQGTGGGGRPPNSHSQGYIHDIVLWYDDIYSAFLTLLKSATCCVTYIHVHVVYTYMYKAADH